MAEHTEFAPAERASSQEILCQFNQLNQLPWVRDFLDSIPNMSMVLNEQRQIVFANRAFTAFLGLDHSGQLLGKDHVSFFDCPYKDVIGSRPGEAVGCTRARLTEGGCGTTRFCQTCGAVASILNSQRLQKLDVQECRMIRGEQGVNETALDLRVWSRPIELGDHQYTIFSVVDISNEKRRKLLERIFFHDVLNTAGGIKGLSDMLAQEDLELEEIKEISGLVSESAEQLIEEINAQRDLSAAETGDLEVASEPIHAAEIIQRIVRQFGSSEIAKGKVLDVDPDSDSFELISDPVLLRRVLINLVKNALEAIEKGGAVTLGTRADKDGFRFTVHNVGVIPSDVQLQIFSRSFSTKGSGRGIGTYSIKLISEKYLGAQVSFVSNFEEGTRFTIRLPRAIQPSET